MISLLDVERYMAKPTTDYYIRDNIIYSKQGDTPIIGVDAFLTARKKELHCDFECLFHDECTLSVVYRCRDCGAIIFTGDDERYNPALVCPVCSDKGPQGTLFWTKEEVATSVEKQKRIEEMLWYKNEEKRLDALRKKRKGKEPWELGSFQIKTHKHIITFRFERELYCEKGLKGLNVKIDTQAKTHLITDNTVTIPLSFRAFYLMKKKHKIKKTNIK